jgi:sulfate transport system substrate-binding protein
MTFSLKRKSVLPLLGGVTWVATSFSLVACGGGSSDVVGGGSGPKADTTLTMVAYAVQ